MRLEKLAVVVLTGFLSFGAVNGHVHRQEQAVLKVAADKVHEKLNIVEDAVMNAKDQLHDMAFSKEETVANSETMITYIFNKLFPFGPAGNAILATTYISGPPNLFLALIPADIEVSSLSLLVSFAVGGLLGDVFLHLLPETFTGQSVDLVVDDKVFVLVDDRKNVVLGIGMFVGFLLFFMIDKLMRIIEHGDGDAAEGKNHSHGHSHSHNHNHNANNNNSVLGKSTAVESEPKGELTNRKKDTTIKSGTDQPIIENPNTSVKTSAYLNLISDFTHNITDGLAIASSFYISKNVGCTTAIATFMHEIPHEVGDFALLIQGGFTKWQAMGSQFVTAVGAYLGTFIGIALQQSIEKTSISASSGSGILGTSLTYGDMTLPFTAGGFFYIAFSVIPELLEPEQGSTRKQNLLLFAKQLTCMLLGIGFMAFIALNE